LTQKRRVYPTHKRQNSDFLGLEMDQVDQVDQFCIRDKFANIPHQDLDTDENADYAVNSDFATIVSLNKIINEQLQCRYAVCKF
jgi:hypothetical protein